MNTDESMQRYRCEKQVCAVRVSGRKRESERAIEEERRIV